MSTLFSDDFNRANGGLGGNYTDLIAGMAISSNQVAGIAGDAATYYSGGTPGANCWAQIKFATKTAGGGNLGIRLNTGTFDTYFFSALTGSASISRQDAGVPTVLGSTFTTPADGTVVRLEMRGSTISVYYDDVLQTTRTDATYSSAGRTFFSCNGAAHRYDDFSTGTLPTISAERVPNTSTSSLRVECTTDDASGTLYVVADTASLSGITASQIKAGQNASSSAAAGSGNSAVSGTAPSVTLTGLSAGTSYNVAVLQFSGGNSNILTFTVSTQATTGAGDSTGPGLVIGDEAGFVGEGAIGAPNPAASGYTLTMGQGSYALTGQAAGLRLARRLSMGQGAYSLNGQAAGVRRGFPLVAAQGSYSLTGQAAALRAARVLVLAQGSYALTGQAVGIARGLRLALAQGLYSLTGQDVTLTKGAGARVLAMDQGAYSLTGQAVSLAAARRLVAAQGSYALTGQAVGLRRGFTLLAAQGAYALTGQAVALRLARQLALASGAYSLAGQDTALVYGSAAKVLLMATGFYTLTGQAVAVRWSGEGAAGTGDIWLVQTRRRGRR